MEKRFSVQGVTATAPRPTKAMAMLLASALSVPVFIVLNLIEWMWF